VQIIVHLMLECTSYLDCKKVVSKAVEHRNDASGNIAPQVVIVVLLAYGYYLVLRSGLFYQFDGIFKVSFYVVPCVTLPAICRKCCKEKKRKPGDMPCSPITILCQKVLRKGVYRCIRQHSCSHPDLIYTLSGELPAIFPLYPPHSREQPCDKD